jgi:hypothetical protein
LAVALARKMSREGDGRTDGRRWGTALVLSLIVVSAVSLVRNYQHPKQDYEAALQFVEASRQSGEPVVMAGGIGYVYQLYYG